MKKYATKLLSLLMALCMVGALCVPAVAMDSSAASEVAESRGGVTTRMRVGAQYVMAVPAYRSETTGELLYYDFDISGIDVYPDAKEQNGTCRLTKAETTDVLNKFKAKYNVDANTWILAAMYSIYSPGDGSYGKYFEFDAVGNSLVGNKIRFDVGRNDSSCPIVGIFAMPENTSGTYNIGLHGGFYYYSAAAKKDLSSMVQVSAYFNSTF